MPTKTLFPPVGEGPSAGDLSLAGILPLANNAGLALADQPAGFDPDWAPNDQQPAPRSGNLATFLRNSASNVIRTGVTAVVSLLLPTFLTHRLPVRTYAAWILILQLSAYVAYLNLGVQTAVAKYIAEYRAKDDLPGCGRCASAGLRLMLYAGALGILLSVALALLVPRLFHEMPAELMPDVRLSILLVGLSLSIGLGSSVFSAIFLGLQRYEIPMITGVIGRVLYGAAVCAVVLLHGSLLWMAAATAILNLLTSFAEIGIWRRLAPEVEVRLRGIDTAMLRQMFAYCGILTVWSACMLFISGLDVAIVGHYDFPQVAFYSIGNAPTNMILLAVGSLLGPLLPVTSALSVSSSPRHMGELLLRSTRLSTLVLLVAGVPVLVAGYPILRLWVGALYAVHSLLFLHVLLIANLIRMLGSPYSTMVVAISRQRAGTLSAVAEGLINLCCSIALARRYGAIGVALGTLIGAFVGVGLHFVVTMHYTRTELAIGRLRLFASGMLRPATVALPTLLLVPLWWQPEMPAIRPAVWVLWLLSTGALAWQFGLVPEDRAMVLCLFRKRMG